VEQVPAEGDLSEAAFDVPPEHILQSSKGKGLNSGNILGNGLLLFMVE
jgi:hypothetical protein